jgi:limonene-1,2-epoxide hydrolase
MLVEEQIVREMLDSWLKGPEEVKRTWADHCAENIVWWNSGRGAIEGRDTCLAAISAMDQLVAGFAYVKAPIRNLIAAAGLVIVERSDDLYRADDSLIAAVPVVGVIEFEGEKITSWRDYCDDWMRDFRPDDATRALA